MKFSDGLRDSKKGELILIKSPYPLPSEKIKHDNTFLFKLNSLDKKEDSKEPYVIPNLENRKLFIGRTGSGKVTAMKAFLEFYGEENNIQKF